ncbi:MAG: class I SAM-dependent methyltransferase [Pseudomonadota bacterium]
MSESLEQVRTTGPDRTSDLRRQRSITSWFNQTYATRGLAYLRPEQAYEVFSHILGLTKEHALLDVACGPGLFLEQALQRGAQACGVDISEVAVALAQQRSQAAMLAVGSADKLPYADSTFDCVSCLGSLERFLSAQSALGEMHRVIRRDGKLLVMVRNSLTPSWQAIAKLGIGNQTGHQGAASLNHWQGLIEAAGFVVVDVYPDQWPLMRWQRLRHYMGASADFTSVRRGHLPLRFANELIFLCKKPGASR